MDYIKDNCPVSFSVATLPYLPPPPAIRARSPLLAAQIRWAMGVGETGLHTP